VDSKVLAKLPAIKMDWLPGQIRIAGPEGVDRVLVVEPFEKWTVLESDLLANVDRVLEAGSFRQWISGAHVDDVTRKKTLRGIVSLLKSGFLRPVDPEGQAWLESMTPYELTTKNVKRRRLAARPSQRKFCEILVTKACNLRCPYCSVPTEGLSGPTFMSLETARKVAGFLRASPFEFHITITGGEPLLHPDLPRILKTLRPGASQINVNTNGTLLTTEEQTKQYSSLLNGCCVSIDGHNGAIHDKYRGTGSFAKAIAAVNLLKKTEMNVQIRSVRVPGFDEAKMRELVNELKVGFFVNGLCDLGRGREFTGDHNPPAELTALFEDIALFPPPQELTDFFHKKLWVNLCRAYAAPLAVTERAQIMHSAMHSFSYDGCPSVKGQFVISTDGKVYTCSPGACTEFYGDKFCLGDIYSSPDLAALFDKSPIAQMLLKSVEERPGCMSCFARYHCTQACVVKAADYERARTCERHKDYTGRILWRFDATADFDSNVASMFGDLLQGHSPP